MSANQKKGLLLIGFGPDSFCCKCWQQQRGTICNQFLDYTVSDSLQADSSVSGQILYPPCQWCERCGTFLL